MTRRRRTGTAQARALLAVATAIAIGGCASLRDSVSGWFGGNPEPPATPAAARQGQTYYSAVEALTVYAEAASSSNVVGPPGMLIFPLIALSLRPPARTDPSAAG